MWIFIYGQATSSSLTFLPFGKGNCFSALKKVEENVCENGEEELGHGSEASLHRRGPGARQGGLGGVVRTE